MKINKITFPLIVVALVLGVYLVLTPQKTPTSSDLTSDENSLKVQKTLTNNSDSNLLASNYTDFSDENVKKAQENGRTLLFFHANWCPTCRSAEKDIINNSSTLPTDLTIIKVNYDKETALKERYNITYQHTFVQIDENGNELAKWGGGGVKTILQNLKETEKIENPEDATISDDSNNVEDSTI